MIDNYDTYSFSHSSGDTHLNLEINETDETLITWPLLLNKFIRFLEMTHDYNIMSKVRIQYSPYGNIDDAWSGEFFDVPEDKDEDEQVDDKAGLTG